MNGNGPFYLVLDTIKVVVICTVADAKVLLGSANWLVQEQNFNYYNVYFYEYLPKFLITSK